MVESLEIGINKSEIAESKNNIETLNKEASAQNALKEKLLSYVTEKY